MSGSCALAASAKITRAPATANRGRRLTARSLWSNIRRDLLIHGVWWRMCARIVLPRALFAEKERNGGGRVGGLSRSSRLTRNGGLRRDRAWRLLWTAS